MLVVVIAVAGPSSAAHASVTTSDLLEVGSDVERLLDLLSPLGESEGNAAVFFAELRPGAPRAADLELARKRAHEVDLGIDSGPALAPDDPLLVAAAAETERARCAFFPEVVPFVGWETWRVDEDLALLFARSWVAESRATGSPEPALRAVRLGRLLLQEDVWFEPGLAGRRAIVLGVNELRVQAASQERWPDALACIRVLARQQFNWFYLRLRADDFARRQGSRTMSSRRARDPFSPTWFEKRAEPGSSDRLRAVASLWRATGPTGGDRKSRAAAAELLEDWVRRDDPVVSAAAKWWAGRQWSPDSPVMRPAPPRDLQWAREAPDDPAEAWLGDRVPPSVAWCPPPSASSQVRGPAAPYPEALRDPPPTGDQQVRARTVWSQMANGGRRSILPADDPLLVAAEAWLLSGAKLPPPPADPRVERVAVGLQYLIAGSLPVRAESLRGTPEASRSLDAMERLLRLLEERYPSQWRGNPYRLARELQRQRSSEALTLGRGEEAAAAGASAMAHELSWWWSRELTRPLHAIEDKSIKRGFFGFGAARAAIEDADLDVCERFAGERQETAVRLELADALFFLSHVGKGAQRRRAERLLVDLSKDSDELVAARATELLDREFTQDKKDLDQEIVKALDAISDGARSLFGE